MKQLILAMSQKSYSSDILVWGLFIAAVLAFVALLFWQRRKGRELRSELEQLARMKENDIEAEFVLRAMKLTTWHLDPKTMTMTFDSDFRDKSEWAASYTDGESPKQLARQLHPHDAERVFKALTDLCEGRSEDYRVEYRVLIPNTNRFYWEESFATVVERDVDGKPCSIVGTTQRIDDRKRMEEALISARNRAEESDRLKSAFIANMSHEIRTPLNAIVGFTSILPDITSPEERQGLIDLIQDNTQNLLTIIDDVVNISKIESGQEETVMSNFELNMMLAEQTERYRQYLKPGVNMSTHFACEQQTITTDYNRLCEIVKHLLSNATKFTTQGSIEIGYDAPANRRIDIWVRDTGKGIAEENLERVFERFFKVDEFIPGAGLGLSTCRTMAFSLGGEVTVESKLGEGSTFTVDIPIL